MNTVLLWAPIQIFLYFLSCFPKTLADESTYWQTFSRFKDSESSTGSDKNLCFPKSTSTIEHLGSIVTTNSTSVCIHSNIVVHQIDKTRWEADFEVRKKVLAVLIKSGSTRAKSSMLRDFVVFGSLESQEHVDDYKNAKDLVECVRYLGGAFKRNEKRTFKCHQEVTGRYLYIWGLGSHRIMSDFIEMVKIQFAVEVKKRPSTEAENPKMYKQYAMSFVHMSRWDVTDKGIWLITMSEVYNINHLLVKVPKILHGTVIKAMKVDLAILDIKGMGDFSKHYKSVLSPSGQEFIFEINFKANNIRMMADEGDYLLTDDAIESIELMYENQQGEMNIITEQVHVVKTEILKEVVRKLEIKAELQVWLEPTYENTGWIMVDMKQRFFIVTVAITSGNSAKVTGDLQGLVISTSNMIPEKVLNEMSKLEFDLCGEVGDNVTIQPDSEKLIKCMPQASLGTYVLIYNKRKPLRISAIRRVVVYVQVHNIQKVELPVPVFPRVPDKPPQTTIVFTNFIVVTSAVNVGYGFQVIDMFEGRPVHAVVFKTGLRSKDARSFSVYVQDSFVLEHNYVCARFMTQHLKHRSSKYLECQPGPRTGRYVILSKKTGGFRALAFKSIEVWFYHSGQMYSWRNYSRPYPRKMQPLACSFEPRDWFIIYPTNKHQENRPMGWWVVDLKSERHVYSVVVTLTSDSQLLEEFEDVYVGLMDCATSMYPSICSYRTNAPLTPNHHRTYDFRCANHPYKFRWVIIRSNMDCIKFDLNTIVEIKVIYGQDLKDFKYVEVDTSSFKEMVPYSTKEWKMGPFKLHQSKGKYLYVMDCGGEVNIAMVSFTVFKAVKTKFLRIFVLTRQKKCRRTCFFYQSQKPEMFYPYSEYKFRCSSRLSLASHLMIVTQGMYLEKVLLHLMHDNQYYTGTWKNEPGLKANSIE